MAGRILTIGKLIDLESLYLDYNDFIDKLKNKLINSVLIYQKQEELRQLKYKEEQEAIAFVEKIQKLARIVYPKASEEKICELILDRLSRYLVRRIHEFKYSKNLNEIIGTMVLAHNECCLLRNRKGESEYQKDREPKSKKPEEANEKHQPCNICHKKGHSAKHCWYKDKPKVYEDHKDNNKITTKIYKAIFTKKGAENEELIDCKFAFTLKKEMNIVPSVNITILDDKG